MKAEIFSYSTVIKEHHLDTFGHVNNATYLELLEEARWEFLTISGFGLQVIQDTHIGPVVLECTIKFLKELLLRQTISITSQIVTYDKKIGTMQQKIFVDNVVCCDAHMTFGLFDLRQRKLILPSAAWLSAIGVSD